MEAARIYARAHFLLGLDVLAESRRANVYYDAILYETLVVGSRVSLCQGSGITVFDK